MPHSCPRVTRSVSNTSMSRIVFIVRPFSLAQSRIIRAFSGTSQITVLMAAGKTNGPKLINSLRSYQYRCPWSGVLRQRCRWVCGALLCTFVNDVADGLRAESVIQRYRHHGVCVTGQLWDGPLREKTDQHLKNVFEVDDNNCKDQVRPFFWL